MKIQEQILPSRVDNFLNLSLNLLSLSIVNNISKMKIKYQKNRKQHMKSLEYIIQLKLNAIAKQTRPRCDNRRGKCTFEGDSLQLGQTLFEFAASYIFISSVYTKFVKIYNKNGKKF